MVELLVIPKPLINIKQYANIRYKVGVICEIIHLFLDFMFDVCFTDFSSLSRKMNQTPKIKLLMSQLNLSVVKIKRKINVLNALSWFLIECSWEL